MAESVTMGSLRQLGKTACASRQCPLRGIQTLPLHLQQTAALTIIAVQRFTPTSKLGIKPSKLKFNCSAENNLTHHLTQASTSYAA
jgi:hypothetical protein